MTIFRALIPGPAVEQARPKAASRGKHITVYDPEKCRNYKAYAKGYIAKYRPKQLMEGALSMLVVVYVLRPKSWPKKRIHADTKPDWDNFGKMISDCCEGLVYRNDSQIADGRVVKLLTTDNPRVEVRVKEFTEEDLCLS